MDAKKRVLAAFRDCAEPETTVRCGHIPAFEDDKLDHSFMPKPPLVPPDCAKLRFALEGYRTYDTRFSSNRITRFVSWFSKHVGRTDSDARWFLMGCPDDYLWQNWAMFTIESE